MRLLTISLLALSFQGILCSQSNSPLRFYTSVKHHQDLIRSGDVTFNFRNAISRSLSDRNESEEYEDLTIPVVFNVLYTARNRQISPDEIEAQLRRLNDDFAGRAEIPKGDKRIAHFSRSPSLQNNANIRFCLAVPESFHSAINYRLIDTSEVKDIRQITNPKLGLPAITPNSFLNVWIMPRKRGDAGFAQFPGGPNKLDGIVISQDLFGVDNESSSPFSGGRTLTHLVGNYLGLLPLWGQSPCGDDGIRDTPVHNGPNFGESGDGHLSLCPGNPREMTMNFMDSGNDDQLYSFTPGQIELMRAVLSKHGPRNGLVGESTECSSELFTSENIIPDHNVKLKPKRGLSIFPNPTHDETTISTQGVNLDLSEIKLMDMSGREVYASGTLSGVAQFKLNTSIYKPGLYFISVELSNGLVKTKRLVIK